MKTQFCKYFTALLFTFFLACKLNAQTDGSAIYVNDMDYVLGDVKQALIRDRITNTEQVDKLIEGFKAMKVNGIRIPIFAEGLEPNKAIFDYFFDQALAAGFKIFANPAEWAGGQRIACEIVSDDFCHVFNNNQRTELLIDRIKDFAAEYPCDWINPFNEDGAPGGAWSAQQMSSIYAALAGQLNGAELIGSGAWGIPASISVLNNTNVAEHITVATTHNLGWHHSVWPQFIAAADTHGLPVWDSEVNNNISEANNRGTSTRLEAAISAGVDGLVLYDSWNYISLDDSSINNAGQLVMNQYLKFRTDKKYYIENVGVNKRLAADGESELAYGTAITSTGDDVEWIFVDKGNGYYHIRRAAGGSNPGLRTNGSEFADMQATSSNGVQTYYDFSVGASTSSYYLTLPDWNWGAGRKRLQMTPSDEVKFVTTNSKGTWVSFKFVEAGDFIASEAQNSIVHIKKRNALGFALDGMKDGSNAQNIYLWSQNENTPNQQWIEIDRGSGFFSYQKIGTDYCIDGGQGGENRQNVYLWTCSASNHNQHWQKKATDSEYFQLLKRNAPGFAIDGGSGGSNGKNVGLYEASNPSHNLQWSITAKEN